MKSALLPFAMAAVVSASFAEKAVAQQGSANPTCFIPFSSGAAPSDAQAVNRCIDDLKAAGTLTGVVVHPQGLMVRPNTGSLRTAENRRITMLSQDRADAIAASLAVAFPSAVVNTSSGQSSGSSNVLQGVSARQSEGVLVTGSVSRTILPIEPALQPAATLEPTYEVIPVPSEFAIDNFQYVDPFLRNPDLHSTADLINQTQV